jgi:hypothetical protein
MHPERLPTSALSYLYRARWQVELLFKQWKSVFRLEVLPSKNPYRLPCEVGARLLAALLAGLWHQHTARSNAGLSRAAPGPGATLSLNWAISIVTQICLRLN